jgi:hypothetical protein
MCKEERKKERENTRPTPFLKDQSCTILGASGEERFFRATFNEGPRSRVQWNRAILLDEGHKLDPQPLDQGPSKTQKWQIEAKYSTILEGKSTWFEPTQKRKKSLKMRAHNFKEPRCKLGSNSRIQFTSNESKLVPKNLNPGPHLK